MKKDINKSDNLNKTAASNQTSEDALFHATHEKSSGMTTDALIQTADFSNTDIFLQFINQGNELAKKLKPLMLILIIMSYIFYLFFSFSTGINGERVAGLSYKYESLPDQYQLTENNIIDKRRLPIKDLNGKDYLRKNRKGKQLLRNKIDNPAGQSGMLTSINNNTLKDSLLLYNDNNLETPELNISSLNSNNYTCGYNFGNDYNSWSATDICSDINYKDIWFRYSLPQHLSAGSFSPSLSEAIRDIFSQSEIQGDAHAITYTQTSNRTTSLPDLTNDNCENIPLLSYLNQDSYNLIFKHLASEKTITVKIKDITDSTIATEDLFDLRKNNLYNLFANTRLMPGWYTISFITNSNTISERILIPKN